MTRRPYDGFRWGRTLPTGAVCPSLTPEDGRVICDDAPLEIDVAATARRRGAHERVWRCRWCRALLVVSARDIDDALHGVPRERCERATAGVLRGGADRYSDPDGWRIALAGATPEQRLDVVRRIHDPGPSPQQEVAELEALLGLARHSLRDRGDGVHEAEITADDGSNYIIGTAP